MCEGLWERDRGVINSLQGHLLSHFYTGELLIPLVTAERSHVTSLYDRKITGLAEVSRNLFSIQKIITFNFIVRSLSLKMDTDCLGNPKESLQSSLLDC